MVLVSSPSSFFAQYERRLMVFVSDSLGRNTIILGEILATSLVLVTVCLFPIKNLAAVFIDTSFGD
jgi:hypothetical protein